MRHDKHRSPPFWLAVWAAWVIAAAIRVLAIGLPAGRPLPHAVDGLEPAAVALDRARLDELAILPGLGPIRAEAVVLDRVRHGPVRAVEALVRVPGIGSTTVEQLRPFVTAATPVAPVRAD